MGDVLPLEQPDRGDRKSDGAPEHTPSAAEDEAADLGAFLIRQLEGLNARHREYTERLERVAAAMASLKARMFHSDAPDIERAVLDDELEGVEALRDELIAAIRKVDAQFKEKLAHLERMAAHRRDSGREAA